MSEKKMVDALINGGQATAGPPLGPALGPLGVNMKVPVKIAIDTETKEFEISVGTPTTPALIVSELGVEKGSENPKTNKVGDLSLEQILRVAKVKRTELLAGSLKAAVKEVLGSCVSMGVTVEDKDPRDVQREIDEGKHNELLEREG